MHRKTEVSKATAAAMPRAEKIRIPEIELTRFSFESVMSDVAERESKIFDCQTRPESEGKPEWLMTMTDDMFHAVWLPMEPYLRRIEAGQDLFVTAFSAKDALKKAQQTPSLGCRIMEMAEDFREALPRLRCRIARYEEGCEGWMLRKALHMRKLDFVLIPYYEGRGWLTDTLPESAPRVWQKSEEEIIRAALEETKKACQPRLWALHSSVTAAILPLERQPMYVLTAGEPYAEAWPVSMMMPGVLEDVADRLKSDFYLLPWVRDGFLVVPMRKGEVCDPARLRQILASAGAEMASGDVLSGSVYIFRRGRGLTLA